MTDYWPALFIAVVPVLILVRGIWRGRSPKDRDDSDPWRGERKHVLFSNDPEDITVRSADNYRLLSETQLDAYEDDA